MTCGRKGITPDNQCHAADKLAPADKRCRSIFFEHLARLNAVICIGKRRQYTDCQCHWRNRQAIQTAVRCDKKDTDKCADNAYQFTYVRNFSLLIAHPQHYIKRCHVLQNRRRRRIAQTDGVIKTQLRAQDT